MSKFIRVFDLARELNKDAETIIKDLRQIGADVKYLYNYVEQKIADKIRYKYFPKKKLSRFNFIKLNSISKKSVTKIPIKTLKKDLDVKNNKNYEECIYCRRRIESEKINTHQNKCQRNPELINFSKNPPVRRFKIIKIKHTPIPENVTRKSKRCINQGCENPVGMTSDICYDCICSGK